MIGFEYRETLWGNKDKRIKLQMKDGITITKGDALGFTAGKLDAPAATAFIEFIAAETKTAASGAIVEINVVPTAGIIWQVKYTPLVNGLSCASNASTTTVKCALADGSTGDMVGGMVYIPELDQARFITANTYSSNVVTITVAEAFSTAPTTTHTAKVIGFGPSTATLKLDGSTPKVTVSNVRADLTGGHVSIHKVDPKNSIAQVLFNQAA